MDPRVRDVYRDARNNIFSFCKSLRFEPTWQQRLLLEAVQRGEKKIAVKSGQGPGKTTCSVVIALWLSLKYKNTQGVLTAPTMRQCRDVWIAEARRVMRNAEPWLRKIVRITTSRITFHGRRDWGIIIMTATNPEAAQGFHNKKLFVICEEASGIPTDLITQFKGTLSNPNAFFLMIGNPNSRVGEFFRCFTSNRAKWHCLTFNAEETPESSWFSHQRNKDLEDEFGRDSDVYRVRVLGEFPNLDPHCIICSDDIEACTDKKLRLPCARMSRVRQIGYDVARFGGDENAVYLRQGNAVVKHGAWARTDPNAVLTEVWRWQEQLHWRNNSVIYVVDAGGMGQGIMSRFYQTQRLVHEFHSQGKPMDNRKYANKITEAWFTLSKLIKAKKVYLPKDRVLQEQLSERQYGIDIRTGLIYVEKKKEYMARGHESPDRADALCMAFYDAQATQARVYGIGKGRGRKHRNKGR